MSLFSSDNGFCDKKFSNESCDVSYRAKQTQLSFHLSDKNAINCFDLIHCDIWGAYRVESLCGAHYFLSIVDDASRVTWVYLMKEKSEASQLIMNFCLMVKIQFNAIVKTIRSDNGMEFISGPMKNFYGEQGIIHQTSCVDTPQQNGRVERNHRHMLNVDRALRFQADLTLEFWGECVLATTYLINRTPSSILGGKTPYEILFKIKPSYVKVFGCLCYVHNYQRQKDKFAPCSKKYMFIDYPFGKKG